MVLMTTPTAIERLELESEIIARSGICPSCREQTELGILDHADNCRHIALIDLVAIVHDMRHFERELEETTNEDDVIMIASAIHEQLGKWRNVVNHVSYVGRTS
jgi:Zn ribbon nucleic-acid-binding protein